MIPFIAKALTSLPSLGWILAIGGAFTVGGMAIQQKILNPPPVKQEQIDYARIQEMIRQELATLPKPEPAVAVQPFDVNKIKGLKSFNYAPSFSGNVSMSGVDSAAVHRWITGSVLGAFQRYVTDIDTKDTKKRRRK